MDGNSFELIMQEMIEQQRYMQALEVENEQLRQQIATLRAGGGIVVEILGTRFPIVGETTVVPPSPQTTLASQNSLAMQPVPTSTASDAVITPMPIMQTPLPEANFLLEEKSPSTPFLEELLLDEFAEAATSPMAVWSGPTTGTKQKPTHSKSLSVSEEDKRAALRRELMGSFLLE